MAKRIDPNSLTIDAKKILEKASIQDRRDILANPAAQSFLAKLTPTEYAKLFPFARQLPDIGKAMSGGTTTAPGGGTISPPGGGAAPSATPTPSGKGAVPSAPQYVKPQASSNAQQNSFLEFLNRMSGGRPSEIRKDFEAGGTSASGSWNIRKDVSPDGRPASIRYNNPGASWTRERDELFGVEGYGIIGGGNRIGKYPTMVHGLASNMDLFSSSKN